MRFVTETRLNRLQELIGLIPDREERSHAYHLIESIRHDIEGNYAEILKPIGLPGVSRRRESRLHDKNEKIPFFPE